MGAGASVDDDALRAEILDRIHGKSKKELKKEGLLDYLSKEMKERIDLGKSIAADANPKTIGKAALHQVGTYVGMAKNNARLRRERKILRQLVEEKRGKRNEARAREYVDDQKAQLKTRLNDMDRAAEIAKTKVTDPDKAAEMQQAFEEDQRVRRAKAQEIARERNIRNMAGKRQPRRTGWDSEDTKNLAYGGPWGLIASAVRHKRQNDINDLEDEYKQLEEQGYGRFKRGRGKKLLKPGERYPRPPRPGPPPPMKGKFLHPDEVMDEMRTLRRKAHNEALRRLKENSDPRRFELKPYIPKLDEDDIGSPLRPYRPRPRPPPKPDGRRPTIRPRIRPPPPSDAQSSPPSAAVDPNVITNLRRQREEFNFTNGIN